VSVPGNSLGIRGTPLLGLLMGALVAVFFPKYSIILIVLGICGWAIAGSACQTFDLVITYPVSIQMLCISSNCVHTNYSDSNALHYLHYSLSTYCPMATIQNWSCSPCHNISTHFLSTLFYNNDNSDTFGFAVATDQEIVIAFRGTVLTELANVVTDISSVIMTPWLNQNITNAEVGYGFYEAYLGIKSMVISSVIQLRRQFPTLPVVVTGHSLGGALASICSVDLYETLGITPIEWTFGSPRVGNDIWASYHQKIVGVTWRTVNMKDPVPHLPPGGQHVTTEVWFQNDPVNFKICSSTNGEDPTCSDSIPTIETVLDIGDHTDYLGTTNTC